MQKLGRIASPWPPTCCKVQISPVSGSFEGSLMARVESRTGSSAAVLALARLAFRFVRQQVDRLAALARVLRGAHRRTENDNRDW